MSSDRSPRRHLTIVKEPGPITINGVQCDLRFLWARDPSACVTFGENESRSYENPIECSRDVSSAARETWAEKSHVSLHIVNTSR